MITVIPAIDLIDQKCVRLRKGDFSTMSVKHLDPVSFAIQLEQKGFTKLHLVDLDGARAGTPVNLKILKEIRAHTDLEIDFSGGIRTLEDAAKVKDAGADLICLGSIAIQDPALFLIILKQFGAERIILAADFKDTTVLSSAWKESSNLDIFSYLETQICAGVRNVLCTDISRDGMLSGTASKLYKEISSRFPGINLIGSGGVSTFSDLQELECAGVNSVVVGTALFQEGIDLTQWSAKNVM